MISRMLYPCNRNNQSNIYFLLLDSQQEGSYQMTYLKQQSRIWNTISIAESRKSFYYQIISFEPFAAVRRLEPYKLIDTRQETHMLKEGTLHSYQNRTEEIERRWTLFEFEKVGDVQIGLVPRPVPPSSTPPPIFVTIAVAETHTHTDTHTLSL